MSLPDSWIEELFARLAVRYGSAWIRLWEGIDPGAVRADWAEELDGLSRPSIAHGLRHLPPDRPPTVGQFLALCLRAPDRPPALPAPKGDPAIGTEVLASISRAIDKRHDKEWAEHLREREQAGDKMTAFSRFAWRKALGVKT